MNMNTFMKLYFFLALSSALGIVISAADSDEDDRIGAQKEGTCTVLVKGLSLAQFADTREDFKQNVARYATDHCKKKSGNCRSADKHIRVNDVMIVSEEEATDSTEVALYIRDRIEHPDDAALSDSQLADVFYDYDEQFQDTYGEEIDVLDPTKSWWEWWRILLVTLFSLIVLLLILLAIYLCYDSRRKSKQIEEEKKENISRQISAYENVNLPYPMHDTGYVSAHPASFPAPSTYVTIDPSTTADAGNPPVYDNKGFGESMKSLPDITTSKDDPVEDEEVTAF